jgi:hypothetical protein
LLPVVCHFFRAKTVATSIAMIHGNLSIARYMNMSELETNDCAVEVV